MLSEVKSCDCSIVFVYYVVDYPLLKDTALVVDLS